MSPFKQILSEKKLSLKEFASISGLSSRSLEPYLAGRKDFRNARAWQAVRVADALDIDVHELFSTENNESNKLSS
jgi:transcriptional regulator with XRE-family HTH domain